EPLIAMGQALGKRRRRQRSYSFSDKDKPADGAPVVSGTATLPPDAGKKDKKKRSVSSAAKFSSLIGGKKVCECFFLQLNFEPIFIVSLIATVNHATNFGQ